MMKFGRLPRRFDPRVPHWSALRLGAAPIALPPLVDWAGNLPADFGMMANDRLGDCTAAALYHARQVWTGNAEPPEKTEPDADVIRFYEESTGYDPKDPASDKGGVMQDVLAFAVKSGYPVGAGGAAADGPPARDRLLAFIEVDPLNSDDMKRVIYECGVANIGFNVPAYLMANVVPDLWDIDPNGDQTVVGGHDVVLTGYDGEGWGLISWGRRYRMTAAFLAAWCEEAYAMVAADWLEKTGKTPLGMSAADLEAQMAAIRGAS